MSETTTERQIQTVCLIIIAAAAIGFTLYVLRPVLVPFVLAVFLSLLLRPAMDGLQRYLKLPRIAALIVAFVAGFVIIVLMGGMVASSVANLAERAGEYEAELEEWLTDITGRFPLDRLPLERMGIDPEEGIDPLTVLPEGGVEGALGKITGAIAGILSQGMLVMLFVIFILLGRHAGEPPNGGMTAEIFERIQKYIVTKVIISAFTGALVFLILQAIGIPYALAFGAFAFLLNFIPNIGSIISTLLPLPVILLTPEIGGSQALLAIVLPGIIQFTIGNIIEPKVMGDSLDLHPVVVLMALIFWGMLWGPTGMLLAVPLTSITKIVLEKTELTLPMANALAGRFGETNSIQPD